MARNAGPLARGGNFGREALGPSPTLVPSVRAAGRGPIAGGPAWTLANGKCVAVGGEGLEGLELRSNMTRDAQDVCRGSRGGGGVGLGCLLCMVVAE